MTDQCITYPEILSFDEPVREEDRVKAAEAEGNRLIGDIKCAIAGELDDSTKAEVAQALKGIRDMLARCAHPLRDDDRSTANYSDGSPVFSLVSVDSDSPPEMPSIDELVKTGDYLWQVVEKLHLNTGCRVVVMEPPRRG